MQHNHYAVKTLILADGTRLKDQVVDFDAEGRVASYRPLKHEEPFCVWIRGTIEMSS